MLQINNDFFQKMKERFKINIYLILCWVVGFTIITIAPSPASFFNLSGAGDDITGFYIEALFNLFFYFIILIIPTIISLIFAERKLHQIYPEYINEHINYKFIFLSLVGLEIVSLLFRLIISGFDAMGIIGWLSIYIIDFFILVMIVTLFAKNKFLSYIILTYILFLIIDYMFSYFYYFIISMIGSPM